MNIPYRMRARNRLILVPIAPPAGECRAGREARAGPGLLPDKFTGITPQSFHKVAKKQIKESPDFLSAVLLRDIGGNNRTGLEEKERDAWPALVGPTGKARDAVQVLLA